MMINPEIYGKRILIGLISHNRLDFTKKCLETLTKTSLPYDLLVVDNGSEDDVKKELFDLSLQYQFSIVSVENRNCNGARDIINHYGLDYDYIIYLDNDAILPQNWLEQMIQDVVKTNASLLGIRQARNGDKEAGFFGNFKQDDDFIVFQDMEKDITEAQKVDWVTGHCLLLTGDFLREIWKKYELWNRKKLFPIDLDDIDLMMMAGKLGKEVFVSPLIVPQNKAFTNKKEASRYNGSRNDFHNYALSAVSFKNIWGYNVLLNWNNSYSGNPNKPGRIYDTRLKTEFEKLLCDLKEKSPEIYQAFKTKLTE